jgi:hypothetical protein
MVTGEHRVDINEKCLTMHDPPAVPVLLNEFEAFATRLSQQLSLDAIDWQWRRHEEEWSLTEVVCHLRDVEREIHHFRFRSLMIADNVFLSGEDSDVWAEQRHYRLQDGPDALAEFLAARRETLALLTGIDEPQMWERSGRHAFFGPTSMHELLSLAVRHDRAHWEQIESLLRKSEA